MNPNITPASENPSRRRFLACGALALGAASLVRAQTAPTAPASSAAPAAPDAARREQRARETRNRTRMMITYLAPLVARFGPEVLDEVKATTMKGAKERFSKMALEKRDLSAVKDQLWKNLDPTEYQVECLEDTPEKLAYKVTTCPWAKAYRDAGNAEIGYATNCAWDIGFCEGLNPEIKFTRTKTLMQGDDCCNHCYELKKAQT